MRLCFLRVLLTAFLTFVFCVVPTTIRGQQSPQTKNQTVAFINVNVVPMDQDQVLNSQTVIVRDGRITQIGATTSTPVPEGALRIDGQGKYLMPGLTDMHVHGFEDDLKEEMFLYIANGVTTVRHLRGRSELLKLRRQIASGEILGPTLYACGTFVFGDKKPDEARKVVAEQAKAGYDCIKIYGDWSKEGYEALIAAANSHKIPAVGHLARNLPLDVNLPGRTEVSHAEEFIYTYFMKESGRGDWAKRETLIPKVVEMVKANGVAVTGTLVAYDYIGRVIGDETLQLAVTKPELKYVSRNRRTKMTSESEYRDRFKSNVAVGFRNGFDLQKKLMKAFQDAGVKILVGTDASFQANFPVLPGFAVHEELRLLVDSGLTPYQAILAGTRNAAEILNAAGEFGTVSVGKRADLILVEGNPLIDVANAARRAGVMVRGRWIPENEIQKRLSEIEAKFAKN
ncbi:MAG TPA: amidohydrolase family protein [Pyrinomonadaceae bacterium]|nr:amidohydrolase family protein [Pyrinomonadaceae bacterium]